MSQPEETPRPTVLSRRRWLRWLLDAITLGYIGAILYPIYRYLVTGDIHGVASVAEVQVGPAAAIPLDSGRVFQFGNFPAILIRTADGAFHAFNATCTHLGCTVEFQPARDIIWCPCHGGQYDPQTGEVLAGPPPRPLSALGVAVRKGVVFVTHGRPAA